MFTEAAEFYDAIYRFKDYRAEARQVAAVVRAANPSARSILDVACATGEHARWLIAEQGFAVDGLDLDVALLEMARRKVPAGRFMRADMAGFDLGQQYDAIICLFSSIAYLTTVERVGRALTSFRRHLAPEGVVVVEPWFEPGVLDPMRVFRHRAALPGCRIERVGHVEIEGRISRIHFRYEIEVDSGRREVSEVHELGLFSVREMQAAFEEAGFTASFDAVGFGDRGLWVARPAA